MNFPKPYLPKSQTKWTLKWRQRFAKWYWNPWWNAHNFCKKWVTKRGLITFIDRLAMDWLVWSHGKGIEAKESNDS